MSIYSIGEVISWIHNDLPGMFTHGGVITSFPASVTGVNYQDGLPTQSDQDLWAAEYEAYRAANEYRRLREIEYPPIAELVVALFEKVLENRPEYADTLQAKREAVKAKYPKG